MPDDSTWRVLHVKPRQEKSLARELLQNEVAFYLPLQQYSRRVSGRTLTSYLTLFPGYLFVLATREQYGTVLSTRRVVRPLEVPDQQQLWDDLSRIHRLVSSGLPLTAEERLSPGQAVEVVSGALAGMKGAVVRSASGDRFVVAVDFIQRGASVLIDRLSLRPLPVRA